jgi:pyruvate,water dikinase
MNRSLTLADTNAAIKRGFDEFGLLLEAMEMREIGGWLYVRLVPLGGKDRRKPPDWLMPLLIRVVPQIRSRVKRCVEAIRSDKPGRSIRAWYEDWRPDLMASIAELSAVDLAALSDTEFHHHVSKVGNFLSDSIGIHFLLHGPLALTLSDLASTCRDLLAWDEPKTFDMLTGLSEKSSEPARRLAELARLAGERPDLRRFLERIDEETHHHLAEADEEFAAAFAAFQQEFGCRALRYEVADPTLAESPTLILGLIRDHLGGGYDSEEAASILEQKRAETVAEARAAIAGRSAHDRERFELALARAQRSYPVREDNEFYTTSAPLALARYAVLELGRRLADGGQIAQREDVFFLELHEACVSLRERRDQRALVIRRKAERAWVEAHPGPPTYGEDPGPPPSFNALPTEARSVMEALFWYTNSVFAAEQSAQSQATGTTLRGVAASPGQFTGPVRVIMSEAEFDKLRPGDVLVCPITSPVWSVLFPIVGALVTDTGGILAHATIIAREYRVPAVVATGNATRLLRDGQIVTVDGDTGNIALTA